MHGKLDYQSTTFGDCPSDYDLTKIIDPIELKFLEWTDTLQAITTRLKYNIEIVIYLFLFCVQFLF